MNRVNTPSVLIVGQAVTLGLVLAFLVIPGSAIFLSSYGAEKLPFVYLMVAMVGAALSFGLSTLQQRFGLYPLAMSTTLLIAVATLASWYGVTFLGLSWFGYSILVLFSVELQLGFVFIGAQAGRAFDLQSIKRIFPRIVAGFVFGFMIGGFVAQPLISVVGHAEHLLLCATSFLLIKSLLMLGASRVVPALQDDSNNDGDDSPTRNSTKESTGFMTLLKIPLVQAVFGYQILSAMGTQFIEYLVYDRAAAWFDGTESLATFMGQFSAVLNLADLIILLLLGGWLMSRFGLRFGLGANPIIVTALIAITAFLGTTSGAESSLFFLFVAIARISDLTMADAATRTSVNATYKVLPAQQRLSAQIGVEGAGVPIALGLTAAIILLINALPESTVNDIVLATLILCVLWTIAAWWVFRQYRQAVIIAANRRNLDGDITDLDEPVTREAVHTLLLSDNAEQVKRAVALLGDTPESPLTVQLYKAAARHPNLDVQRAMLGPMINVDPERAHECALSCLHSESEAAVLQGIRTLGLLPDMIASGKSDRIALDGFQQDERPPIKAAAIAAIYKRKDDKQKLLQSIQQHASASSVQQRQTAGLIMAEVESIPDVHILLQLLTDQAPEVQQTATKAVASVSNTHKHDPRIELLDQTMPISTRKRWLKACRQSHTPELLDAVAAQLFSNQPVSVELVKLLRAGNYQVSVEKQVELDKLFEHEVQHVYKSLDTLKTIKQSSRRDSPTIQQLHRALMVEIRDSALHLLQLLGLRYNPKLSTRLFHLLNGRIEGDTDMALESIDMILAPHHRQEIAGALKIAFNIDEEIKLTGRSDLDLAYFNHVLELAENSEWARHQDWLQACALALLQELGADPGHLKRVHPLGPISSELIEKRLSHAASLVDIMLVN